MNMIKDHLNNLRANTSKDIHPLIDQLEAAMPKFTISYMSDLDIFKSCLSQQEYFSKTHKLPEITIEYDHIRYVLTSPVLMSRKGI